MTHPVPKQRRDELEKAFGTMPKAALHCRDFGHSWRAFQAYRLPRRQGFEQILRCERCGTDRHSILNVFGDVISRHYRYPDGYLVDGIGRLTGHDRGMLRVASILDGPLVDGAPDSA